MENQLEKMNFEVYQPSSLLKFQEFYLETKHLSLTSIEQLLYFYEKKRVIPEIKEQEKLDFQELLDQNINVKNWNESILSVDIALAMVGIWEKKQAKSELNFELPEDYKEQVAYQFNLMAQIQGTSSSRLLVETDSTGEKKLHKSEIQKDQQTNSFLWEFEKKQMLKDFHVDSLSDHYSKLSARKYQILADEFLEELDQKTLEQEVVDLAVKVIDEFSRIYYETFRFEVSEMTVESITHFVDQAFARNHEISMELRLSSFAVLADYFLWMDQACYIKNSDLILSKISEFRNLLEKYIFEMEMDK